MFSSSNFSRKNNKALAVVCAFLSLMASGCAGIANADKKSAKTVSVSLSPSSANLQAGTGTQVFTATVQNNVQGDGVTWSLSGTGCTGAACGTLSATSSASGGNITYTAPPNIPSPATVNVTATAVADTTKSSSATITITTPISVSVTPSTASVQTGQTASFKASVSKDSQNNGVTWTLSGAGCTGSACGTLSATSSGNGSSITYTAPASAPSPATVTLTATSVTDPLRTSTATITITTPGAVVGVTVSPVTASVQASSGTQAFTATVTNDSQNKGVTWALSGTGCSGTTCGTLSATSSASGAAITYTAPTSIPNPATVTMTATSVTDGTKQSAATITVTAAPAIMVSVTPTAASVQAGVGTQSFTATVTNDSQNKGVNWALAGAGCSGATCGTLSVASSASGAAITYTAPTNAPAPATVTLTATSATDATKSAAASITVTPAVSVSLTPTSATVQTGLTQSFTATVSNDAQNKGVNWALSGTGCTGTACGTLSTATSASGVAVTYTAPATLPSPAAVAIKATSVTDTTRSASAAITLTATPVITVSIAPATQSVQAGIGTQSFTATVANDSQNKGVSWSLSGTGCSGATCGTLSATTSASGAPVTYKAPSNAPNPTTVTLKATSVADGTKLGTATITITAAVSVSVAPTSASVQTGLTQSFTGTVSNDTKNKGVNWALSGTGCTGAACGTLSAASSASGTAITYTAPATVPSPATVTITATSVTDSTRNANATITVTAASTGTVSVSLTPKRGGLTLGQSLGFTATVTNDVGNAGVTWTASSGSFSAHTTTTATYVAPNAAGLITVTATSVADGSKSATATIGVTDLAGVTTYHNDLSRDGVNAQEYALTTSNVATAMFGKLFSCTVDGAIYAQPLWVANVTISGTKHNVVIAATQHESVYAFDADASPCSTLWHANLIDTAHGGTSGETSVPSGPSGNLVGSGFGDTTPEVGVTGTPVIDLSTNTIYVVSKSVIPSGPTFFQRIHALDLTTGSEKFGGPTAISASVSGTGDGSSGGTLAFNARTEHQRPGLALANGIVYITWASHEDSDPYHGWVIGYSASTLAQVSVFNDSPNGSRSGIWMSGGAPAVDSNNNLYVITGNGTYDGTANSDYGDSFVKLGTSGGITVADWFTPADQATLEGNDTDFGSGGAAILVDQPSGPVQHLVIGGGKEGNLFLLNRDNMGHFNSSNNNQVVQTLSFGNGIFATSAFWNNALYLAGVSGPLKTFSFNTTTGLFHTTLSSQSSTNYGFPGATPSISATATTNGIVWAIDSHLYCTNQSSGCGAAVLHAYDATNLATELWNSSQGTGNAAGFAVKFTVPTVANGKVYIGTRGNNTGGTTSSTTVPGELDVYGLLPN